jgi:hypothetical protein
MIVGGVDGTEPRLVELGATPRHRQPEPAAGLDWYPVEAPPSNPGPLPEAEQPDPTTRTTVHCRSCPGGSSLECCRHAEWNEHHPAPLYPPTEDED